MTLQRRLRNELLTERAMSMTIASLLRAFLGAHSKADTDSTDRWFPIKAAVVLLAFYVVLHLTVGAMLHFLDADIPLLNLLAGSTD
jgi:hypothetical protein